MKRKLAAVVVCVAMLGIAGGQPPPPPAEVPPPILPVPTSPVAGSVIPAPSVDLGQTSSLPRIDSPAPPAAPVPPSFDALVNELKAVRTQKAELEKREKAITEAL